MIALASVAARAGGGFRKAASVLVDVSLRWDRGVLAVLGAPADGTTALLEVLAGELRPRRGQVSVTTPKVVHVRAEPALPEGLRVDEVIALEQRLRAFRETPPARARLEVLGMAHLLERNVTSLSRGEARAVQLALALTAGADLLLLEEPLATLEAPAAARFVDALREIAATCSVVLTTASAREASRVADRTVLLVQGRLGDLPDVRPRDEARLVVVVTGDASSLVAALEGTDGLTAVASAALAAGPSDARATAVTLTGASTEAVALAAMRAVAATDADVLAIEPDVVPLDRFRAAAPPGAAAPEGSP